MMKNIYRLLICTMLLAVFSLAAWAGNVPQKVKLFGVRATAGGEKSSRNAAGFTIRAQTSVQRLGTSTSPNRLRVRVGGMPRLNRNHAAPQATPTPTATPTPEPAAVHAPWTNYK